MTAIALDLEWRTTLLTLLLFPVLVALGFWQLERAEEKAQIAAQQAQRTAAPASPLGALAELEDAQLAYRQAIVSGYFEPGVVIFRDNQMRDGRYGHDVYGVFIDEASGLAGLLNRGWVAGDPARRSLPPVDVPAGRRSLLASVYVPPGEAYLLAADEIRSLETPVLVQDPRSAALQELIRERSGHPLFPHELRLAPAEPLGFRRDWPVVNVSPEKHRGYALQWFTMAAVLLLVFALRSSNILSVLRGSGGASESKEN